MQQTCGRWCRSFHTRLWLCPLHSRQSPYTVSSEEERLRIRNKETFSKTPLSSVTMSGIWGILKASKNNEKQNFDSVNSHHSLVSAVELNDEYRAVTDLNEKQSDHKHTSLVPTWYHHPSWVTRSQVDSSERSWHQHASPMTTCDRISLPRSICMLTRTSVLLVKTKCVVFLLAWVGFCLKLVMESSISNWREDGQQRFSVWCSWRVCAQGVRKTERESENFFIDLLCFLTCSDHWLY